MYYHSYHSQMINEWHFNHNVLSYMNRDKSLAICCCWPAINRKQTTNWQYHLCYACVAGDIIIPVGSLTNCPRSVFFDFSLLLKHCLLKDYHFPISKSRNSSAEVTHFKYKMMIKNITCIFFQKRRNFDDPPTVALDCKPTMIKTAVLSIGCMGNSDIFR